MAERALRSINGSGQTGMDETPVENKELIDLLEKRLRLQDDKSEVAKAYRDAHKAALAEIDKLDIPDGQAIRIGRFRITRSAVAARHVEFDTDPTSRLTIELFS
jgi:hypothetical protein